MEKEKKKSQYQDIIEEGFIKQKKLDQYTDGEELGRPLKEQFDLDLEAGTHQKKKQVEEESFEDLQKRLLEQLQEEELNNLDSLLSSNQDTQLFSDTGRVISIGDGIATCTGLLNVKAGEMVIFPSTIFIRAATRMRFATSSLKEQASRLMLAGLMFRLGRCL